MKQHRERPDIALLHLNSSMEKRAAFTLIRALVSGVLDTVRGGSLEAQELKRRIWDLKLLDIVLINLQQEASKVRGAWETLDKLVNILRFLNCTRCLNLKKHAKLSLEDCFPAVNVQSRSRMFFGQGLK